MELVGIAVLFVLLALLAAVPLVLLLHGTDDRASERSAGSP